MLASQKVALSSPISGSSSDNPEKILPCSFKLKPIGSGGARNTLVENDSLSSYSWPGDTPRCLNRTQRTSRVSSCVNQNKDLENEQNNSARKASRAEQGHDVIDLNPSIQQSGPIQGPSYIEAYMKLMYWACVSPFNPTKNSVNGPDKSRCDLMLNVAHKVCFAIIMSLSVIQSLLEAKYSLLYNFSKGNLETFINMSYFILVVASKTYYTYFLLRQQWKITKMFESWEKLHAFKIQNLTKNKRSNSAIMYTIVLGTVSICVSLVHIIWDVGLMDWTPEKTVQYHFEEIAEDVFVWRLDEFENGTLVETFVEENGSGLTATRVFLGGLRMLMIFCSHLHNDSLTNMMLSNAETIQLEMGILEAKLSNPESDRENISLSEFLTENGDWAHFKLLKQAINDDNDAFDSLLKYKHANNLMLFVYFVLNAFDGDFSLTHTIRLLYNIIRASYTYRIATQASSLNDAERKWIRGLAWKSNDRPFLDKVPLILDELDKEPIGMGKGQFLIDESFLYRFIGSVGSVFVLQAQSRESKVE